MSSREGRAFLKYAIEIGAIELVSEGRELKSGRISPYFFNSGLFSDGRSIFRLAQAYVGILEVELKFKPLVSSFFDPPVLFGPAYKGIPLVAVIASVLSQMKRNADFAFNRKEAKRHGEGGFVVGASLYNKEVVIIDDVITTGESKQEAIDIIRAEGGTPIACLIAFDRQEKLPGEDISAKQSFEEMFGIPVFAVATLSDLVCVLQDSEETPLIREVLPKIKEYQEQYGV